MGVGVVLLLVMLEGFRRVIMGMGLPRWKMVFFIAGNAIGYYLAMWGIRELLSGRRIGVTNAFCILIGIGINYIVARETWTAMSKKKPSLVRTRTGRVMELLAFVLLALLLVIILMLSGRSDFRI